MNSLLFIEVHPFGQNRLKMVASNNSEILHNKHVNTQSRINTTISWLYQLPVCLPAILPTTKRKQLPCQAASTTSV